MHNMHKVGCLTYIHRARPGPYTRDPVPRLMAVRVVSSPTIYVPFAAVYIWYNTYMFCIYIWKPNK